MNRYRFVAEESAVRALVDWPDDEVSSALAALDKLCAFPNQPCDLELPGFRGRPIKLKRFGLVVVTYWEDAPVRELRIVTVHRR